MRRLLLGTLAVLIALVTVTVSMSTAQAARRWVWDGGDNALPAYDTQRLWLASNDNGYVAVEFFSRTYHVGAHWNSLDFYLDTRRDSRWDYYFVWSFGGDGDHYTAERLQSRNYRKSCSGLKIRSHKKNTWAQVDVFIPRRCLSVTKMVRVKAETWDFTHYTSAGKPNRGRVDRTPNRGFARI